MFLKSLRALIILLICSAILVSLPGYAELLDPSQLKETSVTVKGKKKKIYCNGKISGTAKVKGDKLNFTSFAVAVRKITSRSQRAKKAELVILKKAADKECKKVASNPNVTPTPTPSPTPAIPLSNFDSMGNATEKGKIEFEIPLNLSANVTRGRSVYTTNCVGCHIERNGRTFTQYREIIARSPMLFDESQIPNQELADLVAYMNRFRP